MALWNELFCFTAQVIDLEHILICHIISGDLLMHVAMATETLKNSCHGYSLFSVLISSSEFNVKAHKKVRKLHEEFMTLNYGRSFPWLLMNRYMIIVIYDYIFNITLNPHLIFLFK